jgi:hypothetical protein
MRDTNNVVPPPEDRAPEPWPSSGTGRDELARSVALVYAAATMHFVRRQTVQFDRIDASSEWRQHIVTYHGHLGSTPRNIDAAAQEHFMEVVSRQPPPSDGIVGLGNVVILGEEASVQAWDPERPGRSTIIRTDPIDGTSTLAHCGDGFSSVVTLESRRQPGADWKHLGGAIVRSDGLTVSWSRQQVRAHHVVLSMTPLDPARRPEIVDLGPIPPFAAVEVEKCVQRDVASSGASVAAHSAERRKELRDKFPNLHIMANHLDYRAGTTSAWQLCNGMLGFVIELYDTTLHDSAHLLPLYLLGGEVVTHDYSPIRVLDLMQQNADPRSMERVVPPYIAFSDKASLELVRNAAKS